MWCDKYSFVHCGQSYNLLSKEVFYSNIEEGNFYVTKNHAFILRFNKTDTLFSSSSAVQCTDIKASSACLDEKWEILQLVWFRINHRPRCCALPWLCRVWCLGYLLWQQPEDLSCIGQYRHTIQHRHIMESSLD